jgi:predicted nucleic acid-binding protein
LGGKITSIVGSVTGVDGDVRNDSELNDEARRAFAVPPTCTRRYERRTCARLDGPLLLPSTILIEAGWTINRHMGASVHAQFLDLVIEEFELVNLIPQDVLRMAELVRVYRDARLDPADVSVAAIAERLAIAHIVTLDRGRDWERRLSPLRAKLPWRRPCAPPGASKGRAERARPGRAPAGRPATGQRVG